MNKETDKIKVIDARMGRGKTSAAITYMKDNAGKKKFLYITPYLDEVERICTECSELGFVQPDQEESGTKLADIKRLLAVGDNIATTHSLYTLLDDDALEIIRGRGDYCLIVDESLNVVSPENISQSDIHLTIDKISTIDEDGYITNISDEYSGGFDPLKKIVNNGGGYRLKILNRSKNDEEGNLTDKDDGGNGNSCSIVRVMKPELLTAFSEVIVMTYLFNGQYMKAYFDFFGFSYDICGVDTSNGYHFSDGPDKPEPVDYKSLIHIIESPRLNNIGNGEYDLSHNWYNKNRPAKRVRREAGKNAGAAKTNGSAKAGKKKKGGVQKVSCKLNTFYQNYADTKIENLLWTTFKDSKEYVYGERGRFRDKDDKSDPKKITFLSLTSRATNRFKDKWALAYLANRYPNTNVNKFFFSPDSSKSDQKINIDKDLFALSEMLQWIWRSRIRDNKEIVVYIPSKRMRNLLKGWIEDVSKGGDAE